MIRPATIEDLPAMWELAVEAHALSPYKNIPICKEKCHMLGSRMVTRPDQFAWVSEVKGKVEGVLLGYVDEIFWSRKRQCNELLFYCRVPGDGYKLAKKLIQWSRDRNNKITCFPLGSGRNLERTEDMYKRMGLRYVGGNFLEVNDG